MLQKQDIGNALMVSVQRDALHGAGTVKQALAAIQTTDQEVISPRAVSFVLPGRTLLCRDHLCARHGHPRCSALPVCLNSEGAICRAPALLCLASPLRDVSVRSIYTVSYRRSSFVLISVKGRGPGSLRETPELGEAWGQGVGLQPE